MLIIFFVFSFRLEASTKAPAVRRVADVAKPLVDSRKCAHSRAYYAAAKATKNEGMDKAAISKVACAAAKAAAAKWDADHA